MSPCTHEVYRYFHSLKYVTPKEMANLICGADPRGRNLLVKSPCYESVYRKIEYAVKKSHIKCEGAFAWNSKIDSKIFFQWAVKKFPEFAEKLPIELVPIRGEITISGFNTELTAAYIPKSHEELTIKYLELLRETKIMQKEIERLSVFERKKISLAKKLSREEKHSKN